MAVLAGADLNGTKLCRADLPWANLDGAALIEADFTDQRLSVSTRGNPPKRALGAVDL